MNVELKKKNHPVCMYNYILFTFKKQLCLRMCIYFINRYGDLPVGRLNTSVHRQNHRKRAQDLTIRCRIIITSYEYYHKNNL